MSGSADLVAAALAGERLEYPDGGIDKATAERMLAPTTEFILAARERNAALAGLDLEAALERVEHEWMAHRGALLHLELHVVDPGAPTAIVVHGLGDHSRRHLGLAAAVVARGVNALLLDRRGHGLSEGHRGDSPVEDDFGAIESAVALARARFSGPVGLVGDSLGGICVWYLLTREPDVDAAVCHCIAHPDVSHDPAFRIKAPLMRVLGRVAPYAPISVRQIADYEHVALDPVTLQAFRDESDPLFNFTVTARSAASYIGFRPALAWEHVETPVLVAIGGADRMVTPRFTQEALERATPASAEFLEIDGAGHQLFLDDLGLAIEPVLGWLEAAFTRSAAAAAPA